MWQGTRIEENAKRLASGLLRSSPAKAASGTGILAGCLILSGCHQVLATYTAGLPLLTALAVSAALGAWLALADAVPSCLKGYRRNLFAPAAWFLLLPWLLQMLTTAISTVPVEWLARPGGSWLLMQAVTLVLVTPAAWCISRLFLDLSRRDSQKKQSAGEQRNPAPDIPLYLLGLAVGVGLNLFLLAPVVGVQTAGLLAVTAIAVVLLCGLFKSKVERRESQVQSAIPAEGQGSQLVTRDCRLWQIACAVAVGCLISLLGRVVEQLMPMTTFLFYAEWASVLAGLSLGLLWGQRRLTRNGPMQTSGSWVALLTAVWCLLLLAVFPFLIEANLWLNSRIAEVGLLMTARSLQAAVALLPLGLAWGVVSAGPWHARHAEQKEQRLPAVLHGLRSTVAVLLLSLVGARWLLVAFDHLAGWVIGACWVLLLLAVWPWGRQRSWPSGLVARGMVVSAAGVILAAPLFAGQYDPAVSAKCLFSTNIAHAYRSGTAWRFLPFLDEGRAVAVEEGQRGTYTAWNYHAGQVKIRQSGMPTAIVSADPAICPNVAAEVMPAVMPLVLHERPHRVLLLGIGGGVPLSSCLSFPVQEVTCLDGQTTLVDVLARHVWPRRGVNPLQDDRVRFLPVDPALALQTNGATYDVVISTPGRAASMQATPDFTRAFYQRVARRLAPEGIFCQRFQQVDFGPQPLQVLTRTMQSVFEEVQAFETGPGEVLLLATNSKKGLIRGDLLARMKKPQVRRVLSRIGWDWSVLMYLSAYNDNALSEFAAEGPKRTNTRENGYFAFHLPQEVMRWGAKWQATQQRLASRRGRLLQWSLKKNDRARVASRWSQVTRARRLKQQYPDQYWAYRKTLREQVQKQPRSQLRQVSGGGLERTLHPEDQRRIRYFEVLGEAARQGNPHPEQIRRIAAFASPYDPLLSYFLHKEVAALYSEARPPDRQAELRHRLHAVFYSHSRDRSVRNIAAAIKLVTEHPSLVAEAGRRWDYLDALLQMLKHRWERRGTAPPSSSPAVRHEIEQSITAAESALAAMKELRRQIGVPLEDWQARREYLQGELVRPLRTHRKRMLSRHLNQQGAEDGQKQP